MQSTASEPLTVIEQVLSAMRERRAAPAIFWRDRVISYADFSEMIDRWVQRLDENGIGQGSVCAVIGDYSPQTCALFFALMRARAVAVPFTRLVEQERTGLMEIAAVRWVIDVDEHDSFSIAAREPAGEANPIVSRLSAKGRPGLIVFTSGSTGKPKGILHDCERVMQKFATERPGWRTVLFLMMDHFGGFNTFLSAFAYGGVAVCVPDRSAEAVCRAIQESRADLLPTTPTFLNLLIASGSYRDFDLSSVKLITYGTEVMPEATLQKIRQVFPHAKLKQTYGLSELGVLRSKSKDDDSVWVRIGGDGFEVKIVDQILWVRSESSMIGYLNAPDPFDDEGWMCTGDHVEVRGDYVRILGRKSEFINVGGQKVFPTEVESVLLEADNVREATAYAAPHPIFGQVVHCRVSLGEPEDPAEMTKRLRKFCVERMAKFKIPMRFNVVEQSEQRSDRFKKVRRLES